MEFRHAVESDLGGIMEIIREAKLSLKMAGIDQWQDGYPDVPVILQDIGRRQSYVLEEDSRIVATAAVTFLEEKDYQGISGGGWDGSGTYAVIHRLAILEERKGKGLADLLLSRIEALVRAGGYASIRTDTHEDNVRMQKLLVRNGFSFRGLIYIGGKEKRRAFEKRLEEGGGNPDLPGEKALEGRVDPADAP